MKTKVETPDGIIEVEVTNAERLEDFIERVEWIEVEHSDGWFMEELMLLRREYPARRDVLRKMRQHLPPPPIVMDYISDLLDLDKKAHPGGATRKTMHEAYIDEEIRTAVVKEFHRRHRQARAKHFKRYRQVALRAVRRDLHKAGIDKTTVALDRWVKPRGDRGK